MNVLPEHVRALHAKYTEMLRLRLEHARGDALDPRPALLALAARFPGALRELDRLSLPQIEQRIAELAAVIEGAREVEEWMRLQISYHGHMRAALRIKRVALASRAEPDAHERVFAELALRYSPASDEPPFASFDRAAILAIVRPEGGRLNPVVFARVAELHGVDAERVRAAFFPG